MKKNIYCLEGMWNDYNLKDKSSVLPILELLQNDKFDTKGIGKILTNIYEDYGNLPKIVDLKIVINDKNFKRTRITNSKPITS